MLPPDVNTSVAEFSAVGEDVRFGLQAIRNVGSGVVEAICEARREFGPAAHFHDFLDRAPLVAQLGAADLATRQAFAMCLDRDSLAASADLVGTRIADLGTGAANQPHTSGNFGFELRPFRRLRIIESWMTARKICLYYKKS